MSQLSLLFQCNQQICRRSFAGGRLSSTRAGSGCCASTSRLSSSSTRRPAATNALFIEICRKYTYSRVNFIKKYKNWWTLITFIWDTWRKWDKKKQINVPQFNSSNCSFSVSLARMCEVSSTDSETPSTCRVWLNWADKAKCIELVLNWELLFAHCTRR